MTGVPYKSRQEEEDDLTYAPFVVGVGLLILAVTLTLFPIASFIALAVIVTGIFLWIRESVKQNRALVPPEIRRGNPSREGFRNQSDYWWGAVGFVLIQWVVLGAAMRVAHAHGLLDPAVSDIPVTMWIGHALTGLAVVSAGVGIWASAAARNGGRTAAAIPVGVLILTALLHLGLLGLEGVNLRESSFFAEDIAKRSATTWLYLVHGTFVFGAILAMIVLLFRILIGPLDPQRFGIQEAVVLFWWGSLVSWLVFYVMIYLKLIQFESHLL